MKLNGLSEVIPRVNSKTGFLNAHIVGVGTVDNLFLTPKAEKAIMRCGIVVGWTKTLEALEPILKNKLIIEQDCATYKEAPFAAAEMARTEKKDVAVLVLDDPLTYSGGINRFKKPFDGFKVEFIPAVSSLQLAAAAAQVSLEDSLLVVYTPEDDGSIDQKDLAKKRERMLKAYQSGFNLVIMSDLEQTLAQTATFLIGNGVSKNAETVVGEQIGSKDEKVFVAKISKIAKSTSHWVSCMVVKQTLL